ncbi:hypothetical protein ACSYAD_05985 [Acaryochloris marina NIES-2412]|uniref:hypothetical protein n=1 Tax=Acaryochloris marina TaxID=155978 RepID=UPI00405864D4
MESITREQLKQEIDTLDAAYLGLVYRVLRQFPHLKSHQNSETQATNNTDKLPFSQRWRGKLGTTPLSPETLATDPRLAYLSDRYNL